MNDLRLKENAAVGIASSEKLWSADGVKSMREDPLPCLKRLREVLVLLMARATDGRGVYEFQRQLVATDLLIRKIEERRDKFSYSSTAE